MESMSLIQDILTWWSSTADWVVTRLLEMKRVIRPDECVEHLPSFLREQDWAILEQVKSILENVRVIQRVF